MKSPKHVISSKISLFSWGEGIALYPDPSTVDHTRRSQPSLLDPPLRPQEFQPDSSRWQSNVRFLYEAFCFADHSVRASIVGTEASRRTEIPDPRTFVADHSCSPPPSPEAPLMASRSWSSAISCEPASRSRSLYDKVDWKAQHPHFSDATLWMLLLLLLQRRRRWRPFASSSALTSPVAARLRRCVNPRDNSVCEPTTTEII